MLGGNIATIGYIVTAVIVTSFVATVIVLFFRRSRLDRSGNDAKRMPSNRPQLSPQRANALLAISIASFSLAVVFLVTQLGGGFLWIVFFTNGMLFLTQGIVFRTKPDGTQAQAGEDPEESANTTDGS